MSSTEALKKEAKKRARRSLLFLFSACFLLGIASSLSSFRTVCSVSNSLRALQCPPDGVQFGLGIVGGLVTLVLLGLPFGFLIYNDIKWSLYGYEIPAKGIVTRVLWTGTMIIEIMTATFRVDIPSWIGVIVLATIYLWFIFSMVYYSALRKQYADDLSKNKLPRMKILEVLEKEKKINEEIMKNNDIAKNPEIDESENNYDDGL